MNEGDMDDSSLEHGDLVEIETALRAVNGGASSSLPSPTRSPVDRWPPTIRRPNGLVPLDHCDKESGTPSYKSVPVHVRKVV